MEEFVSYVVTGISIGVVYGIVALGFVLIYKSSKILNFALGEFLILGAYVFWVCWTLWHLPLWLSIIITLGAGILIGLVVERVAIRPLIGQPVLSIIMMTIAVSVILRSLILLVWGPLPYKFEPRIFSTEAVHLANLSIRPEYAGGFIVSILLLAAFIYLFRSTRAGLLMRAASNDHQLARAIGVRIEHTFALSWIICGMVAAIIGVILASLTYIDSSLGNIGLKVIAVVLIGGLESIPGAFIGGLIIGISEGLAVGYIDPIVGGGISEVFAFAIAVVALLIRPYGVFGLHRIERI